MPEDTFSHIAAHIIMAPAHDKTNNKACVTSEDSDQPAHPLVIQGGINKNAC